MIYPVEANEFFFLRKQYPLFDVRAPQEHLEGHIPGAVNLPLFDDEERKRVGIMYKNSGKQAAILEGLGIVGKKLQDLVKKARKHSSGNTILVHCWRGGMRSESVAWLLSTAGFDVYLLKGGYKAYRQFIRDSWNRNCELLVVAGKTGTGKTEIIQQLQQNGQQVLDLEKCAHHKGSAFGAFGEKPQPTNEQFENNLADLWLNLDFSKPIWIEDESRFIGKLNVPENLYLRKQKSRTFCIEIPRDLRIKRLERDYAAYPKEQIIESVNRISRRLGGQHVKAAIEAIENDNFSIAIAIVLNYYDKTYTFDLQQKPHVVVVPCSGDDAAENARTILELTTAKEII